MDEVARRIGSLSPEQRSALLGKLREKKSGALTKAHLVSGSTGD
jgi:hypothetical protein